MINEKKNKQRRRIAPNTITDYNKYKQVKVIN